MLQGATSPKCPSNRGAAFGAPHEATSAKQWGKCASIRPAAQREGMAAQPTVSDGGGGDPPSWDDSRGGRLAERWCARSWARTRMRKHKKDKQETSEAGRGKCLCLCFCPCLCLCFVRLCRCFCACLLSPVFLSVSFLCECWAATTETDAAGRTCRRRVQHDRVRERTIDRVSPIAAAFGSKRWPQPTRTPKVVAWCDMTRERERELQLKRPRVRTNARENATVSWHVSGARRMFSCAAIGADAWRRPVWVDKQVVEERVLDTPIPHNRAPMRCE